MQDRSGPPPNKLAAHSQPKNGISRSGSHRHQPSKLSVSMSSPWVGETQRRCVHLQTCLKMAACGQLISRSGVVVTISHTRRLPCLAYEECLCHSDHPAASGSAHIIDCCCLCTNSTRTKQLQSPNIHARLLSASHVGSRYGKHTHICLVPLVQHAARGS